MLRSGAAGFCLCAGARNADLACALLRAKPQGVKVFPYHDERAAAFFGLGRARALGRPVAVVTTSGTAVAELMPAIIEAHYQALPLFAITADRPARFRGSGAPQAIEQVGLFGRYAACLDLQAEKDLPLAGREAVTRALRTAWAASRPVHLNVCLEEPRGDGRPTGGNLPRADGEMIVPDRGSTLPSAAERSALEGFLGDSDRPLLVMAGCLDVAPSIVSALRRMDVPILADVTSGLHACRDLAKLLVRGGDRTVRDWDYRKVLRLGGVPSFRAWRDLEERPDIEVFSLSRRPFAGLARPSRLLVGEPGEVLAACSTGSVRAPDDWEPREAAQARRLATLLDRHPESEPAWVHRLAEVIPRQASVFVGNSLPIREFSLVAARALSWRAFANRGANGIDGNLATFLGLASGLGAAENWGVFGDLTTLYDLGTPGLVSAAMPQARLRLVVIDNGGGKIFRRLPAFRDLSGDDWRAVENPHRFDFSAWAASWGFEYSGDRSLWESRSRRLPDRLVIEVRPCPEQTERFWNKWQGTEPG